MKFGRNAGTCLEHRAHVLREPPGGGRVILRALQEPERVGQRLALDCGLSVLRVRLSRGLG